MDIHRDDFVSIKNKQTKSNIQRVGVIGNIKGIGNLGIDKIGNGIDNGIACDTRGNFLSKKS
jgi:hypothetical protein